MYEIVGTCSKMSWVAVTESGVREYETEVEAKAAMIKVQRKVNTYRKKRKFDMRNTSDIYCILDESIETVYSIREVKNVKDDAEG